MSDLIEAMAWGAIGGVVGYLLWVVLSRLYMLWRALR